MLRVVQRGPWENWLLLREHYDATMRKKLAPSLRLDPKSANFVRLCCERKNF